MDWWHGNGTFRENTFQSKSSYLWPEEKMISISKMGGRLTWFLRALGYNQLDRIWNPVKLHRVCQEVEVVQKSGKFEQLLNAIHLEECSVELNYEDRLSKELKTSSTFVLKLNRDGHRVGKILQIESSLHPFIAEIYSIIDGPYFFQKSNHRCRNETILNLLPTTAPSSALIREPSSLKRRERKLNDDQLNETYKETISSSRDRIFGIRLQIKHHKNDSITQV